VFENGWTDEQARQEFADKFGRPVNKSDAVVCDDCYRMIMEEEPAETRGSVLE
jgi:hypothetical protein